MIEDAPSHDASLPLAALEQIDRVCAEYEKAWRTSTPPVLHDYLADAQGPERSELLSELLILDLHYRSRQATRFPEDADLLAGVFQRLAIQSSAYAQAACANNAASDAAARSTERKMKVSTAHERESGEATETVTENVAASSGQRFQVLRPHAKGGLGEVFLAYDRELNREVALKEIQEQHAGRVASRERFKIEAEVTGGLEHPGIVPVYSLGAREDGRPFYAMRFVRGESLEEAVRKFHDSKTAPSAAERTLEFRRLLGRFLDVCQAIEYAHNRGVLHRDIKPANVMLGKYGETLVVDWGLAKVMGDAADAARANEEPELLLRRARAGVDATAAGAAMGTPAFMSPEQAKGRHDAVGPRSDIYALGAVLYTILTGRAPVTGASTAEVLRKVQAGDLDAPRMIVPSTPRPLEAICLKAMALEPDLRYASAGELAEDIEAWLADEKVSAYREPLATRARRWMRRHQPSVAAATAAAFVAIISLSVGVLMLAAKGRELQTANLQEAAAKQQAQERFQLALEAIEGYYDEVSQEVLLQQAELAGLRTRLLKMPLGFYERLRNDLQNDSSLEARAGLSDAYDAIARILGDSGALDEAFAAVHTAIEIRESLVGEYPTMADLQWGVVASCASLASFQSFAGDPLEALSTNQRALTLSEGLAARSPHDYGRRGWSANLLNNIGLIHQDMNDWENAEVSFKRAIEIREKILAQTPTRIEHRRHLAGHHHNLSSLYSAQGNMSLAVKHSRTAVEIQEELHQQDPDSTNSRSDLAMGYYNHANHCRELGERQQAIAYFQKSIEIREGLLDEYPNVAAWQSDLAKSLNNCAELRRGQGDYTEATGYFQEAITIHERLASSYPEVLEHQFNLARHYQNLGTTQDNQRDRVNALDSFEKAIQIHGGLAASAPNVAEYRLALCNAQRSLGRLCRRMGENERAIEAFQESIKTCEELVDEFPDATPYRSQMSLLLNSLGIAQAAMGQVEEARASYRKAIELGTQLVQESPEITSHAMKLGGAYCNLAQLEQVNDVAAAIPWYTAAIHTLEPALARDKTDRQTRLFLWNSFVGRANALASLKQYQAAVSDWDRVIELDTRHSEQPQRERAIVRALAGEYEDATAEAKAWARQEKPADTTLYDAARVFACASISVRDDETRPESDRQRLSEEYVRQAIEYLLALQQAGYFAVVERVEKLEQDALLDPIRTHEGYEKMFGTLRKDSR